VSLSLLVFSLLVFARSLSPVLHILIWKREGPGNSLRLSGSPFLVRDSGLDLIRDQIHEQETLEIRRRAS